MAARHHGGGDRTAEPGFVDYDGGLKLRDAPQWLDATRPVPLSFVSNATVAHRHSRIITSARTADLLGDALASSEALASPMGRTFSVGELRVELVPAGHVVGSAQLLLRYRGERLLYCGGVRPGPAGLAEPYEARPADILVLDCPYDAPPYQLPGRTRVAADVVGWVSEVLSSGEVPVLFACQLGMAQDLCRLLVDKGVPVRAHRTVAGWNRKLRALGADPGRTPELRRPLGGGAAVVAPIRAAGSAALRRLVPRPRGALVSGRAVEADVVAAVEAEVGFPMSSHADAKALRKLVRDSGARHVYLGPRHTERFETTLRRSGLGVTRFSIAGTSAQLPLF